MIMNCELETAMPRSRVATSFLLFTTSDRSSCNPGSSANLQLPSWSVSTTCGLMSTPVTAAPAATVLDELNKLALLTRAPSSYCGDHSHQERGRAASPPD